jgi:gliding motility-associated-like protein
MVKSINVFEELSKYFHSFLNMKIPVWIGQIVILFLINVQSINSQTQANLVAYYAMNNNCELSDSTSINPVALDSGTLKCQCGVEGRAVKLSGGPLDFFILDGRVNNYFSRGDFTVAFYFKAATNVGTMDLFSKKVSCNNDAGITVRYNPSSNSISVEIFENALKNVIFFKKMKPNVCWHHFALVRRGAYFRLYLDGSLAEEKNAGDILDLTNAAKASIANSPCLGVTDRRFVGQIDEIRIYNRALDGTEIAGLDIYAPDQMPNRDTTIYLGNTVQIGNSNHCSSDTIDLPTYSWTPLVGVSDERIANPEIKPLFSTTYLMRTQYPGCLAQDSIYIKVIDPKTLSCNTLPIPSAFTPNGDGKNDTYGISNPYSLDRLISFEIIDRIGNTVFKTEDPLNWWDGTFQQKKMNPGVFMYKIKYICAGVEKYQYGTFQLLI